MLKKVDGLKPIADELGVPLAQLSIAWCAANPNVSSVICGATKESQVSFHIINTFFKDIISVLRAIVCLFITSYILFILDTLCI